MGNTHKLVCMEPGMKEVFNKCTIVGVIIKVDDSLEFCIL